MSSKIGDEVEDVGAAAQREAHRKKMLIISFCLMVVVGLGNRITNIVMYNYVANYPLFINTLTTFAYLPTSLLYVIPMTMYRPDVITPEARAIPQKVWFIMGFLDSLAGVLQSLAVDKIVSGSLTVLLLQSAIPSSMLITKVFLKAKYRTSQYIGAMVVIAGLGAALGPSLGSDGGGEAASQTALWSSVLIISCIPMCLSSVYKEKALGDTEIDAIYLNFWVAFWQFLLGFPLLVPMAPASNLPIDQIGTNLWQGLKCYAGFNSQPSDNCGLAPLFVTVYIIFNLGYNILIILMLKFGSSNILWLCLTLQVPVANLVFAIPWMPKSQPASLWNLLGLALIMIGLCTYRFWPVIRAAMARRGWVSPVEDDGKEEGALLGGELDESGVAFTGEYNDLAAYAQKNGQGNA